MLDSCWGRDPILGGWVLGWLWRRDWHHHLHFIVEEAEVQRGLGEPGFWWPGVSQEEPLAKSHSCCL